MDYLIIGQGLAGSALAWELMRRGKSIKVIDIPGNTRASVVAAGLFNPITGKVMTKSWNAEVLFPFLLKFYRDAEATLNKKFLHEIPIYRPFISSEERQQWKIKSASAGLSEFVGQFYDNPFFKEVNNPFGGIDIRHSGYLDVKVWLDEVRQYLRQNELLIEETFDELQLVSENGIRYKDYTAHKIIFCNGLAAMNSNLFGCLPFRPLKGEVLQVKAERSLPRLFNRGVYLVPGADANIYNVGSTYQHRPFDEGITTAACEDIKQKLHELLNIPFEILHQDWGIRPTTPDRRPFVGTHPKNKNVLIFNGLGTKGVSLAPYLASQLADSLEGKGEVSVEVNISRFKTLYWG